MKKVLNSSLSKLLVLWYEVMLKKGSCRRGWLFSKTRLLSGREMGRLENTSVVFVG
jgi:hypothetical protein